MPEIDGPSMSDVNRILRDIYRPALEAQISETERLQLIFGKWDTKLTRRVKFRYWRRRVVSNIRDAWHVLWHGPGKFMDW